MVNQQWLSDTVCFRVLELEECHAAQMYEAYWDHTNTSVVPHFLDEGIATHLLFPNPQHIFQQEV